MTATKTPKSTRAADDRQAPSKRDIVRAALDNLGRNAKPKAIQQYALERNGVEMTSNLVNNYKSSILHPKPAGKRAAKRGRPAASANRATVKPSNGQTGPREKTPASAIRLPDLQELHRLTQEYGTELVQRAAELVGS